jgi:DNA-directed RNA polymerase subunit M/transcription elongation factor TFIIS
MSRINKIDDPEQFRANIQSKLLKHFNNAKDAINLEKAVYNWTIKESNNKRVIKKWDNPFFILIYTDRLKTIYENLKNPKIIELINNNEISVQEFAFMTHQEMCPEKWRDFIEAKKKRDKCKTEQNLEASTDVYTCGRCRSKNCSYYQLQTRSSDEPMTIYVTCLDCGNRFKR